VPVRPEELSLTGTVAVVTGAAVGIGRACAHMFAAWGAGVAVCDRDGGRLAGAAAELEATGVPVHHAALDVRDPAAVPEFFAAAAARLGPLSVLVNNAGGTFTAPFLEVRPKGEAALVAQNFTSVTACTRAFVPHVPADGGAVVNITSIEAHRAAPGFAVYAAMKAAVTNLTATLALELADRRIRVNAVAPDVIPTPGVGEDLEAATPLPWRGHPDDVAAAVWFLAHPRLARFVTGTVLAVDGGNRAAAGWRRGPGGTWVT
jgi:NAD(P)-dependent dehydrogenase (short-subunit alcohol dehydrogenase family)